MAYAAKSDSGGAFTATDWAGAILSGARDPLADEPFALGDHLGFAAANMPSMIFPMIVGKLVGGVTAIGVAMMLVPKGEDVAVNAVQPVSEES